MAQKTKPGLAKLQKRTKGGGTWGVTPVSAPSGANTGAGGYYSPRQYGEQTELYSQKAEAARTAMEERSKALRESQKALEESRAEVERKKKRYYDLSGQLSGDGAAELLAGIEQEWTDSVTAYGQQKAAYDTAWAAYSPYEDAYNKAAAEYNNYLRQEQQAYGAWKATIRTAEDIRAEQKGLKEKRAELQRRMQWANDIAAGTAAPGIQAQAAQNEAAIRELQEYLGAVGDREKLLAEELGWSEYFLYEELRQNDDFAEKSQFTGVNNSGDRLYQYINGNRDARGSFMDWVDARLDQAIPNEGTREALGINWTPEYLEYMEENEVAMYNYLYSTKGAAAANIYLDYLKRDLTARQMGVTEELTRMLVGQNWVTKTLGSAASVPMNAVSGLQGLVGTYRDYLRGEELDPNASYYTMGNIKNTIRDEVAKNWGPVGSFAYHTGLGIADMLADAAAGPGAMVLIGSRSFSEEVVDAKKRGLSDEQAMELGAASALAELLTEKIGVDKMLHLPDEWKSAGFWKGLLRGAAGEAAEEGITNLVNLAADITVAGDQSEFMRSVHEKMQQQIAPDGSVKTGMTKEEATKKALLETLDSFLQDIVGGGISGGVFGGIDGWWGKRAANAQQNEKNAADPAAPEKPTGEPMGFVDGEQASEGVTFENRPEIESTTKDNGTMAPTNGTEPVAGGAAQAGSGNVQEKNAARNMNEDGGNDYGRAENGTEAGTGISNGDERRGAGAGAGEQTFGLDNSPEGRRQRRQQQAQTAGRRAAVAHNSERLGQTQKVSPREIGIATGSQRDFLIEIPREQWDEEMLAVAHRTETKTGKKVRYVDRPVAVLDQKGKTHYVAGVVEDGQIVINATHNRWTVEQIADHEEYHVKAKRLRDMGLNGRVRQCIVDAVGEDRLQETVAAYTDRLGWMKNVSEDVSDEELERLAAKAEAEILEELLADAYAGVNRFEGHAEEFEDAVNAWMDERGIGKEMRNTSAQETDTGTKKEAEPPGGSAFDTTGNVESDAKYLDDTSENLIAHEGEKVAHFIDTVNAMIDSSARSKRKLKIGIISENHASLLEQLLQTIRPGLSLKGYELWIDGTGAGHIERRHGKHGKHDKTMASKEAKKLIPWAAQEADECEFLLDDKGNIKLSDRFLNADGTRAPEIAMKKQVDDDLIFVSECVPDSGSKRIWITSAYIKKGSTGQKLNMEETSPQLTPEASFDSSATTNIVADALRGVKYLEDDGEISQERIDAMIERSNKLFGRKVKADTEKGLRSLQRKMERNRERAQKHKEERQRLQAEARAKIAQEPVNDAPAPETKLTVQKPIFAKKNTRKAVLDAFHIPDGQKKHTGEVIEGYLDSILERGYVEDGDTRNLMDKLIGLGVVEFEPDEVMAEGRGWLKDQHIYVSDSLRQELGDDWYWMQKKAFSLGVYLTTDKRYGSPDMWRQHMDKYMPGLIDPEETSQRAILERLLQIAAEGQIEKMSLSEYTGMLADQNQVSEAELLDGMARELGRILEQFARDSKMEIKMRQYTKNAMDRSWEKNKAYTKRAVDRQRIYREADKAHYREHLQNMRNRRELNKLQERTLKTLQWLNRNKHRAPEELQDKIREVLGDIDLYAIGAADELNWHPKYQMTWKELAEVYKEAKAKAKRGEGNFFVDKELERIVERLDNRKIEDLDIGALNDLFNAAVAVRKAIFDADKALSFESDKRMGELFTEMTGEMKQAGKPKMGGLLDKFFSLEQLTPMNVLRQMGGWRPDGAWAKMAKLLEDGEKAVRAYKVNAARILEDFLNDHADWIHKADGQGKNGIWIEVEIPQLEGIGLDGGATFGDTVKVKMTPMQRVHLYLESKNEDNLRHMVGGRTFADPELYSKGKRKEAFANGITVKMAPETVRALVKDMSPEELELAQLLDSYYNGMAPGEINRVSNILYGFNKAMGKGYTPIFTNQNYVNTEAGIFDQTAESAGNLKERMHAKNPSYNISALDAFEQNVDKTAQFVGMAIPVRDWNALMNWRTKDNSMRDQIDHQWGHDRQEYIDELLVDLQGGHPAKKKSVIERAADALVDRYISAVFGFNPSIVLKQAGSLPLAGAYLGMENMSFGMFRKERRDRAFIAKYTQDLQWRAMGYSMPETKQLKEKPSKIREGGKKAVAAALKPLDYIPKFHTTKESRQQFAEDAFGGGYITKMDESVASILWAWAENKVRKEYPDLEMGDQKAIDEGRSPFYKKVAEEFDRAVSHSQSVSDVAHQSTLRRSDNPILRTFTMFRSDSAQTYNALRQMWGEKAWYDSQAKRYEKTEGDRAKELKAQAEAESKQAAKRVGAVITATACNVILAECVNLLMAAIKGKLERYEDDEEEKLTLLSVLGEMGMGIFESGCGLVTGGDEIASWITAWIAGEKRYDMEAPGLEQIADLVSRIEQAGGMMKDGDILGAVHEMGMTFSTYIAGFPAENMEKFLITGIVKHIFPGAVTEYEDALEAPGKDDLKGMTGPALKVRLSNVMKGYGVDLSDEAADTLAQLYEAGYTSAVAGAAPDKITMDGTEVELSRQAQKKYDKARTTVLNGELDDIISSPFFREADPETQAKMLTRLYDYAAEKAKAAVVSNYDPSDAVEEYAQIAQAGGSIADCIIFKTETADMKNYMKADLLREWDAGDAAKELMFRHLISDSQDEEIAELREAGATFDQFLEVYAMHGQIDAREGMNATEKATEFAHWLEGQRFNAAQKATIKKEMAYFQFTPAQAERYNAATGAGLNAEEALELTEDLKDLGKDPQEVQKWRVAIDDSWNEESQLQRLKAVGMNDAAYAKCEALWGMGVAPAAYVRAHEIKDQFDTDGNGSLTNDDWRNLINSLAPSGIALPGDKEHFNLTNEQMGFLWQMLSGRTSAKNNPFSPAGGEKWLAIKEQMKEDKEG